jgi:NAD(P)-dependent dehydrogenase (short-subunit alcohol dehydrogenase family)
MMIYVLGGGGIAEGIRAHMPIFTEVIPHEECDVRSRQDVDDALSILKPTDWVVVTAGIDDESRPRDVFATNAMGSYNVAMRCRRTTNPLILIASVAGLYGKPNHTAYCMSKAAVISLTQSLGFTQPIWCISPGRTDTPMREAHYPLDTPGSRLLPADIALVAEDIMRGTYPRGANIIIRTQGLDKIIVEEEVNSWREELRVGQPVTI